MNEWVAFGIVVLICGILAALVHWAGGDEPSADEDDPRRNED